MACKLQFVAFTGRRLKEFRLEALRAGFKEAWSKKDYQTIITVAKKIPDVALQEDEKLLLWYDQAATRTEDGLWGHSRLWQRSLCNEPVRIAGAAQRHRME